MKKLSIGNLIKDVSTAINPRDLRRSLTYMRVLCNPDRLVFAGCNGVKLIEKTYPVQTGWNTEFFIPGVLAKGYADLDWFGIKNMRNNLAPMMLYKILIREDLPEQTPDYPNYEPLFKFSHRKGNIRKTIETQAALGVLKTAVPGLDREDNRRIALTQLGWGIDRDANGVYLYQLLKALNSDKPMVRYDNKHEYITIIGENERVLLSLVNRR